MAADHQAARAGDGKPDNGWIHPGLGHPARPFAEWLNSQRMNDVSQVFHEIMARYCSALAAAPAAAPAVPAGLSERAILDLVPSTMPIANDFDLLWFARAVERAHGIQAPATADGSEA